MHIDSLSLWARPLLSLFKEPRRLFATLLLVKYLRCLLCPQTLASWILGTVLKQVNSALSLRTLSCSNGPVWFSPEQSKFLSGLCKEFGCPSALGSTTSKMISCHRNREIHLSLHSKAHRGQMRSKSQRLNNFYKLCKGHPCWNSSRFSLHPSRSSGQLLACQCTSIWEIHA